MVAGYKARRKTRHGLAPSLAVGAVFLVVAAGVLTALLAQNVRLAQKRGSLESAAQEVSLQIAEVQEREQELEQGLELSQGAEYQEQVLRERGLYKKPGETAVTVVRAQEEPAEEDTEWRWWNPFTWFSRKLD